MIDAGLIGGGICAVPQCDSGPIRDGHLMCPRHWERVPRELQTELYDTLGQYRRGSAPLGDLRRVQSRAINAVTAAT